jgi:hypothetical protein
MALAGAFVGVAADVTAADANPAGLVNLQTAQLLVDLGYAAGNDSNAIASSVGSLDVDPVTGARDLPYLNLTAQSRSNGTATPDFVGFAWPFALGGSGDRLVVSGARQVVLHDDRTLEATGSQFAFDTFPNTVSPAGGVVAYSVAAPVTGDTTTDVVYWSASAAYQIHQDFSIGATVSYATLSTRMNTTTEVNDSLQLFVDPTHPRLPAQPAIDFYRTGLDGTDTGLAYSIGVQWHPVTPFQGAAAPWRFGVVYKKGVEFTVPETTSLNGLPDRTFDNAIVVPDRYALGASYALGERWLFALQFERVEYSDMLKGYRSGVNFFTSARVAEGAYTVDPAKSVTFKVDDGTLVRAGAEYLVPLGKDDRNLAVRAGYYYQPDDTVRMTGFNSTSASVNAMYLAAYPKGSSTNHFTAGLGYVMGSSSFQLGVDTSNDGTHVVATYALTFGTQRKAKS